jgi:hypothetical protein
MPPKESFGSHDGGHLRPVEKRSVTLMTLTPSVKVRLGDLLRAKTVRPIPSATPARRQMTAANLGLMRYPLAWSGRRDSNPRPPPWQGDRGCPVSSRSFLAGTDLLVGAHQPGKSGSARDGLGWAERDPKCDLAPFAEWFFYAHSQSRRRGGRKTAQPPANRNTAAMKITMKAGLVESMAA